MMRLTGLVVLVGFVFITTAGLWAADSTISEKVLVYPTYHSLGIEASYTGDDNANNFVSFVYRRKGSEAWKNGVDLTPDRKRKIWRGSIFSCSPGEAYEIKINFKDPDGVKGEVLTALARTRTLVDKARVGRTYYVSPEGSDKNPGTKERPWKTIGRATSVVKAGDTVLVAPGIYREGVLIKERSGRVDNPIVFATLGEKMPIIDGAVEIKKGGSFWEEVGEGIYSAKVDWKPGYLAQDGQRMYLYRTLPDLRKDPQGVKRAWFYDEAAKRLYLKTGKEDSPSEHNIAISRYDYGFAIVKSNYIVVKGIEIRNFGRAGVGIMEGSDGNLIIGNKIHNAPNGIRISSADSDDNAIWNNEVYERGLGDFDWDAIKASRYSRQGISVRAGRGTSIVGNKVHGWFDCIAAVTWKNPEKLELNRDFDIMYNDVYNAGDDGLEPDGGGVNMRIHANHMRNCLAAISLAPIERGPVYVTRNTGTFKLIMFKLNVGQCTSLGPAYVYHNSGYTLSKGRGTGINFTSGIPMKNKVFKNNAIIVGSYCVGSGVKDNFLDYNLYFSLPGSTEKRFNWEGNRYKEIRDFAKETHQEVHGIYGNPLFVDTAGLGASPFESYRDYYLYADPLFKAPHKGDFHLRPNSPARDRGVVIRGINEDFHGRAPDIGAYEFTAQE